MPNTATENDPLPEKNSASPHNPSEVSLSTRQCHLQPKFHYTDFHQNFPAGKFRWTSRTQTMVATKSATDPFVSL